MNENSSVEERNTPPLLTELLAGLIDVIHSSHRDAAMIEAYVQEHKDDHPEFEHVAEISIRHFDRLQSLSLTMAELGALGYIEELFNDSIFDDFELQQALDSLPENDFISDTAHLLRSVYRDVFVRGDVNDGDLTFLPAKEWDGSDADDDGDRMLV